MNKNLRKQNLVSFVVGLLFALGLAISGMTQPKKIIDFLNPWDWDPSLLFVMFGALSVHLASYAIIKRRASPLLDVKWHVPNRNDITARLIIGSALFGIGWGLGGLCPGPALTSLSTGDARSLIFVSMMILGMIIFKKTEPFMKLRE